MKIEFLSSGSPDCPLIRLYAFDHSEACQLRDLVNSIGSAAIVGAPLNEQAWIEPAGACVLEFRLGKTDCGITQVGPSRFECILTTEGWTYMSGLIEPFCVSANANVYQWLTSCGKISLLISSDGTW